MNNEQVKVMRNAIMVILGSLRDGAGSYEWGTIGSAYYKEMREAERLDNEESAEK